MLDFAGPDPRMPSTASWRALSPTTSCRCRRGPSPLCLDLMEGARRLCPCLFCPWSRRRSGGVSAATVLAALCSRGLGAAAAALGQQQLAVGAERGSVYVAVSPRRSRSDSPMLHKCFYESPAHKGRLDPDSMPRPRSPTLRAKPVLMRQTQMSLRQPQAFLRVPRGRLVSLFTPLGRLNAGECERAGPRAARHKRLHLYAATFPLRRARFGVRADH